MIYACLSVCLSIYLSVCLSIYIKDEALSNNGNDLQLLTFMTKASISDAVGVLGLPMPKEKRVEQNTYG